MQIASTMDLKWISVILLFSAVCGVPTYFPHRYHFVDESKTWTEAQTYCRQNYTDLATINNMEEMKKLNITLRNILGNLVWIGLRKEVTGKWRWSLAGGLFYREGDTYRNWNSGEPNNVGSNQFCVEMYKTTGTWNDEGCGKSKNFMCYDASKTSTERYKLVNYNKAWCEAQRYCRENHTDLASVRNQNENQQIWGLVKASSSDGVWIGLFNDSWEWSGQRTSSFRYWASSQSDNQDNNEDCAAVSMPDQGHWYEENCDKKLPFICHENQLILVQKNLTWREALRYCRVKHVGLVSVHSEEIQLWVMEATQKASTEHVWVGLRHTCSPGFWFWVSGGSICYENWAPGNGTGGEDCSTVERTGAVQSGGKQQWVSLPETHMLNFICTAYEG